tara:strand:- start:27185 stop:27826 length:642 start_codon:yes stop_codon:yes gene_type:complete
LKRSFLDSTPQGVSLESSTIFIGAQQKGEQEVNVELAGSDSDNSVRDNAKHNTTQGGRDLNYDKPIEVLTEWLGEMGWTVQWYSSGDHIDAATLATRLVTINKRQIPRHRYYSLLHECAHVDLLAGPPETRSGEPHGYLDLWYATVNERTLRHRVAVVIDEIKTWEHGIKLAHKLGLGVDKLKYMDFRNRNLKSYFEWALERDDEDVDGTQGR